MKQKVVKAVKTAKTAKVTKAAKHLTDYVIEGLQEKKGVDIVHLDLRKLKGSIADHFIVCTGTSDKHVQALADSVWDMVHKQSGDKPPRTEGQRQGEWILMDYVDVIVHIFLKDKRDFYSIEELWGDAEIRKIAS